MITWSPQPTTVVGADHRRWERTIDRVVGWVVDAFGRVEPQRIAGDHFAGLLSSTTQKNFWWLVERAGQMLVGRKLASCRRDRGWGDYSALSRAAGHGVVV